ncbi:MAG: hypothetical protein RBS10_11840 [Thauera propionica]|nr:hypothetical protein [Thauera propionica]
MLLSLLLTAPLTALPSAQRAPLPTGQGQPVQLAPDGIGPVTLGRDVHEAARIAATLDPAAAAVGPGCDARIQFGLQVDLPRDLAGARVDVMAMAGADGRIEEIVLQPVQGRLRTSSGAACRDAAEAFAGQLIGTLAAFSAEPMRAGLMTDEHSLRFAGGARVSARWFRGGGDCDVALHFGAPNG